MKKFIAALFGLVLATQAHAQGTFPGINPIFGQSFNNLQISGANTGSAPIIAPVGGDTNIGLAFTPKGSGSVAINSAATITSNSATSLAVGLTGTTNPALTVDDSTASSATGFKIKSAAAAAGVALSVTSSGTNENLTLDAKGNGTITLNGTATGNITTPQGLFSTGTAGVGYATGAGGAVTQVTSRTTGVTLNKTAGAITLLSAAGSATAATFTVTNSTVAATDTIVLNQKSGTNLYELFVTAVAAGSFNITFFTTGGTATDAPVINFAVLKSVAN